MKNKLMLAAVIGLLSTGAVFAGWRRRSGNCCPSRRRTAACCPAPARACPPACAPSRMEVEPTPPRCCKTIMVDKVIQVPKTVEVPARRIEIPQPDIIEHIPQPAVEVRIPQPPIPQPDIIEYRCVPDKVVRHAQAPCVRYECPADCD